MERFDKMLKAMAEQEECIVPNGFDERIRSVLDGLPPKAGKGPGAARIILIAAAVCAALLCTAFAASPGLREMLAETLGSFAPYAQEQEDKTYVIDGIEFKVVSVLADDFTVRAYVEARDLDGSIFSRIDDLTTPTRVSGGVDIPTVNGWLAPNAFESWSHSAECLSYDGESGTALLVVSTWKALPEDLSRAAVEIRQMNSYLTGKYEEVWRNKKGLTIPADVKPVESTVLGRDTALVSGLDAEEAHLSPLGLSLVFRDYEHRAAYENASVSVKLADGSAVEAPQGGQCSIFLPPENSYQVVVWNFQEPAEAENIEGICVGEQYFPIR